MNYCRRIRLVEEHTADKVKYRIEYDTKTKTNYYPVEDRKQGELMLSALMASVDEWVEDEKETQA